MLTLHRQSVTVDRSVLLEELVKNLATHETEYAEAVVDYQQVCKSFSEQLVKEISEGNFKNVVFKVPAPQSHVQKYKDVIDMLKYSVQDTIELDSMSFKAYIKNEWDWSAGFQDYSKSLKSRL